MKNIPWEKYALFVFIFLLGFFVGRSYQTQRIFQMDEVISKQSVLIQQTQLFLEPQLNNQARQQFNQIGWNFQMRPEAVKPVESEESEEKE